MYLSFDFSFSNVEDTVSLNSCDPILMGPFGRFERKGILFQYPVARRTVSMSEIEVPSSKMIDVELKREIRGFVMAGGMAPKVEFEFSE